MDSIIMNKVKIKDIIMMLKLMMMILTMRLDLIPEDLSLNTSKRRKNQEDFNLWVLKIFSNIIFWTKIDVEKDVFMS